MGRTDDASRATTGKPAEAATTLIAAGGIVGAVAASSCCVVPLVLFALGIGGAWIGDLTALEPYQPIFIAVTAGLLATGYYLVHRQRRAACADDAACGRPLPAKFVTVMLWVATALVAAAVAFPYVAAPLLGT